MRHENESLTPTSPTRLSEKCISSLLSSWQEALEGGGVSALLPLPGLGLGLGWAKAGQTAFCLFLEKRGLSQGQWHREVVKGDKDFSRHRGE